MCCGAPADYLPYLHHCNRVRHGVKIAGGEFSFAPSVDLVPGFDDFFSKSSLDLWVLRQLI